MFRNNCSWGLADFIFIMRIASPHLHERSLWGLNLVCGCQLVSPPTPVQYIVLLLSALPVCLLYHSLLSCYGLINIAVSLFQSPQVCLGFRRLPNLVLIWCVCFPPTTLRPCFHVNHPTFSNLICFIVLCYNIVLWLLLSFV